MDSPRTKHEEDEEIFQRVYPGLRRFAAVVGTHDTDPDDLVQEALVKTLRRGSLHRLAAPSAYLRRTILNLVADSKRAAYRRTKAMVLIDQDQQHIGQTMPALPEALDMLVVRLSIE
ncbi:MAG: RNA polymerase sigma factor [Nocardioides sp.]